MSSPARHVDVANVFSVCNPVPAWRKEFRGYTRATLVKDLLAGTTVAVVALPLALAFGVVSGAGATAGLVTAIVAGLVTAIFGGSRFQVSGPTGAMTVVLLPIIAQLGVEQVFVVGMMAGIMLILAGLARVGRVIDAMPWPVITGFTNGIAIIIGLQQVPAALGLKPPTHAQILPATWDVLRRWSQAPTWPTVVITIITMLIVLALPRLWPKLPAGLIALLAVSGVVALLGIDVPRISDVPTGLPLPRLPHLRFDLLPQLFGPALSVAVLAGLESLLSAVVADGMARTRDYKPNRELAGQGIGNLIAPLFGGIPSTGAIARTAVGVRSGAKTRLTAVFHALVLLLVVLVLGRYVTFVPLAVLSGILLATAFRMFEREAFRALQRSTRSDFFTMMATMAMTVCFDLILAIEVGMAVAALLFIRRQVHRPWLAEADVTLGVPKGADVDLLTERVLVFRAEGPLFFAISGQLLEELTAEWKGVDAIILRLRRVPSLDASGAHALAAIHEDLSRRNIALLISGLQKQPREVLSRMGLLDQITCDGAHEFERTAAAIDHGWQHVRGVAH